jgi:threonine/homoserine/homoserine lactone efflux protein
VRASAASDYDRRVPDAAHLNLWGFAAIAVPLVATPGISTAVVLRNSIAGGIRDGVATAVGLNTASICYGLLAGFGVAVALQRWPAAWTSLRVAGVAYLLWLGLRSVWRAARARRGVSARAAATGEPRHWSRRFGEGFLTNTFNPSIATFYLLVIPTFIPRGAPVVRSAMILTGIHVSLALTWHLTWALAGGALAATLERPRPRRVLESITGLALIALAVKLALA